MASRNQRALVRAAALPRPSRRRRRAGGRRPHAGRPGDDPLYRLLRHRSERQSRSCRARCWAAARAGATTPTATTRFTSCRILRNQPAEFTETRFPLLVEKLALRTDSGGAGKRRGGLGYEKHYRALVDCRTIVTADRVRLGCYGVNGGKAGLPFCVTIDVEGTPRDLGGLVDGEPVLAGQIVRVRTTGGGGWGDPLDREPDLVLRDVIDGKVSASRGTRRVWRCADALGDESASSIDSKTNRRAARATSRQRVGTRCRSSIVARDLRKCFGVSLSRGYARLERNK